MLIHVVKIVTMRKTFFLLILFFAVAKSYSQSASIKPSTIGDKMPDILLSNFMDNAKPFKINDLKGKLVIFDLWNVWCSACVRLMPSLDSLQKKFGDKIKIILVTENKKNDVTKLFIKTKMKIPGLPIMTNDTILNKLFPHSTVPHQIWIDKNGDVKFITDAYNATSDNIQAVLNNKPIELHLIKETANFNVQQSLLDEGGNRLRYHMKYYSFFMNRLDEYGGTYGAFCKIEGTSNVMITRLVNFPLLTYYKFAFGILIPDGLADLYTKELIGNRIIFDVKDPNNFYAPIDDSKKDEWYNKNIFSYESSIPIQNPEMSYHILQQDLNRFFPFNASIERRKVRCFVLKKISKGNKIISHGGKFNFTIDKNYLKVQNCPVSSFVSLLANMNKNISIPIIDGTNYTKNIDITVIRKFSNTQDFSKNLKKYGLELVEEVREINMLVISDKK